jgi:hypothetical protein
LQHFLGLVFSSVTSSRSVRANLFSVELNS